jgi:hypothetical protein
MNLKPFVLSLLAASSLAITPAAPAAVVVGVGVGPDYPAPGAYGYWRRLPARYNGPYLYYHRRY